MNRTPSFWENERLTMERSPQFTTESLHTLYSIGYQNPRAFEYLHERVGNGTVILDIRLVAASRYHPAFSGKRLRERFGAAYQRIRDLGNDNYNQSGAPILLHNPDLGIPQLLVHLEQHDCCLLCRCQQLAVCHTAVVVNLVQQALPRIRVVRLGEQPEPQITNSMEEPHR